MRCTIHQPNYLPWLGFFDKISRADLLIIYDNAQYSKNNWQNRNKIRNKEGYMWVTLPVSYKFGDQINQVKISDSRALKKHWNAIIANYSKTKYFQRYKNEIHKIFSKDWENLSELNVTLIKKFIKLLGIDCNVKIASELIPVLKSKSTQALVDLCKTVGADEYISGRDGREYLDVGLFEKNNIKVSFQEYQHPQYRQAYAGFEPGMCILDLLFNHGPDSLEILKNRLRPSVFAYNAPHKKTKKAVGVPFVQAELSHLPKKVERLAMIDNLKTNLRKQIQFHRRGQSDGLAAKKSARICQQLNNLPEFLNAKNVLVYLSKKEEANTDQIIKNLADCGKKIIVPCVEGDIIRLSELRNGCKLEKKKFGILEPAEKDVVPFNLSGVDCILVPGVAFDLRCNRLGFGGGYYDKMLLCSDAVKIGLAFDFQIYDSLPVEEHDVKMDFVVTEKRVIQHDQL